MPQVFAIGKYDIKFNIKSSPRTFLYQLSSPNTVITKETKSGLIGSSYYAIQENKNDFLILNRNPFYFGEVNIKNSGVVMFYVGINNINSIMTSNKIDGALMYRIESLWNIKKDKYRLIRSNPNITELLVLNNQRFPFNKPIVRKALSSAIYNNFRDSCAPGSHKAYGIIPNGIGGSLDSMSPKKLQDISPEEVFIQVPKLKNKKVSIVIHELTNVRNDCEANQVIKAANKYHIDISFQYHKNYDDLLPLYINHNLDGFIDLYIFKNREVHDILDFFAKHGENDANIDNDIIDNMLKELISTSSSHEKFRIYHRLAQYVQDESIAIPLFYIDHGNLMSKCLSGVSNDFFFNPFSELPKISKLTNCTN